MAAVFDLEKCYNFQIANGELAYWKYGSGAHTSLKLTGAIAYYNKLVKAGVYNEQNPWIYCKYWRIAGTLHDICNLTGHSVEQILSQSFNPGTAEGKEAIAREITQHKIVAPKKEPISAAVQAAVLQEYINQNPRNGTPAPILSSGSAAVAPSAPGKVLKVSQGAINKKLNDQWTNLVEMIREVDPEKRRILNISKFNKATYTGVQKQKLTAAERGEGNRNPDKTALVTLNGRPIPFKFSLTPEAKQAALDYAEYVVKPLSEQRPELVFAQGSISDVYTAIVQTAQENRVPSKALKQQINNPVPVNNSMNVLSSIAASPPNEYFGMDFSVGAYSNITDDLDPDEEGLD